ncbi:MAG: hypothetical protein ABSB38_01405 [Dehalococcoidia bacterium]
MFKTKLSTILALVAVLSLLLVPAAYADTGGTTTGSFGARSQPPTVSAIGIFTDITCLNPALSMDPLTEYYVKVTVGSVNKLSNLDTVEVTLFYDSAGNDPVAPTTPNTQTCAILTWNASGTTWTINPTGGGTTWVLGTCTAPANPELTTGDWIFAFTPGKVATESTGTANWDAQGLVTNKSAQTGEMYDRDTAMNWYGEITITPPLLVDWGPVDLGLLFAGAANPETDIKINYIANGNYAENIKSTNWTGAVSAETVALDESGGNPPTDPGEFALMGNDINALGSAVIVNKTSYTDTDITGTLTTEGGDDVNTNTLWLSLSASGITPDTYSGSIYYQITNR